MKQYQQPTPNIIAERFKFNCRDRRAEESIATYVSELRRLSEHCNYGAVLNDMIRDRLVCGIRHVRMQERLLGKGSSLTLDQAIEIATCMETASKQSTLIQKQATQSNGNDETAQHKVDTNDSLSDQLQRVAIVVQENIMLIVVILKTRNVFIVRDQVILCELAENERIKIGEMIQTT